MCFSAAVEPAPLSDQLRWRRRTWGLRGRPRSGGFAAGIFKERSLGRDVVHGGSLALPGDGLAAAWLLIDSNRSANDSSYAVWFTFPPKGGSKGGAAEFDGCCYIHTTFYSAYSISAVFAPKPRR
jgi:hypothetical protein